MPPPDRAPEVAAFLLAGDQPFGGYEKVVGDLCRRWPGLTRGEAMRGFDIALELNEIELLELQVGIAMLLSARKHPIPAEWVRRAPALTSQSGNKQHYP